MRRAKAWTGAESKGVWIEGGEAGSGRRGEVKWSVSCCGDGNVVSESESDGGGFEERRKKTEGRDETRCEFANVSKEVIPHM